MLFRVVLHAFVVLGLVSFFST